MIWKYIFVYVVLTIVGGLGLYRASRGMDEQFQRENRRKFLVYLALIAALIAGICAGKIAAIVLLSVIVFFIFFELIRVAPLLKEKGNKKWYFIALIIYGLLTPGFLYMGLMAPEPLLFIYTQVVVFDAFSQVTGQLFGRNKLAPEISPAKTIEGVAGGMFFMAISFFILRENGRILGYIPFYLIIVILSITGDLFASFIKRKAGIKDYGKILPGQGGVLDRYDSFFAVCAVIGTVAMVAIFVWIQMGAE